MISPLDLDNRAIPPSALTDRQREVFTLVRDYYVVARELPSSGWISRRMNISRQRAHLHLEAIKHKLDPYRR